MALSLITPDSLNLAQDYSGMGFGGTGSANQMDDYEEGTWTPTLIGSTTNPTVTYSEQAGTYTKIGQLVYITIRIAVSTTNSGSGNLGISGIPFTAKNYSSNVSGALSKAFVYNLATDIDVLFVLKNESKVSLYASDNNNNQSQVSSLQNGCYITASGCYQAD